ncbi:MAG TPA: DUF502 domain-containing protein [Nitrospiria bacterium]|nr:DUF502 domain-containing protein [Candidatus Manganitrophaceae bacterium]HIL33794.1 DUF502 domain-containing protein [Candidatus Manganitrophaceae bacterium]
MGYTDIGKGLDRIKAFFKTSLIGGLVVILPVAILLFVFKSIFGFVTDIIHPLTNLVMAQSEVQRILADIVVLAVILAGCFFVGLFVQTSLGTWLYDILEERLLKKAPGYTLVKETVIQFIGKNKSPFSSVALVQIFGNETLVSAFITDTHTDGSYTVFVPTGPNPTSGNIYHLKGEYVHPVDVPVEDAMRSIISCGAGSSRLINQYKKKPLSS